MNDKLPPGPAFIQAQDDEMDDCEECRETCRVPDGYVWQSATIGTAAGWIRGKAE